MVPMKLFPGDAFALGQHPVVYTAFDAVGNRGQCAFPLYVGSKSQGDS